MTEVNGGELVTCAGERYEADLLVLARAFEMLPMLGTSQATTARLCESLALGRCARVLGKNTNTNTGHGGSQVMGIELQARYSCNIGEHSACDGLSSIEYRLKVTG